MRFLILLCLLLPAAASAQPFNLKEALSLSARAQGAWFDEDAYPSDFELGGSAALGSRRISGVAEIMYGVGQTYLRGSFGGAYTVTDPNDTRFSVDLGARYNVSSNEELRPQEWTVDVSFGWQPWPLDLPDIYVGGRGSYGFDHRDASAYIGAAYALGGY